MDSGTRVDIHISSRGGSINGAIDLAGAMKDADLRINTVVTNTAYSSAVLIAAAGSLGRRFAYPKTEFMIHSPTYAFEGEMTANKWEVFAKRRKDIDRRYFDLLAQFTAIPYDRLQSILDNDEAFYFDAVVARELSIIDEIL